MSAASVGASPSIFLYINVLFAVYSGAALSTSCRLWWDPSLYAVVRELWRQEYRVAAVVLPLLGSCLLLLACLAVRAVTPVCGHSRSRSGTLLTYCWLLLSFVMGSVVWVWWTAGRVVAWTRTSQAEELHKVVELAEHIQPLIDQLDKWMPLPDTIKALIQEAKNDLPRNEYAAGAAVALLLLLLPSAAALALLMLRRDRNRSWDMRDSVEAKRPLKSSLDKGRLVLVR